MEKTTIMYTLGLQRDFIASHYLIGGDWGAENHLHAHHYKVEAILSGDTLDQHGYLVDLAALEEALDGCVDGFRDKALNDLPEFNNLNPSIEQLARLIHQNLCRRLTVEAFAAMEIKVWENDFAWAAYRETAECTSA
jgi:6-pyruvoyltetrahydropterin/6-carboxytetrahydropterin synthase